MKLLDLANSLRKEIVYDKYERLVWYARDYEQVTRRQMLEEIIREYSGGENSSLYCLCTEKELQCLKLLYNHKHDTDLSVIINEYYWEICQLVNKYIIDRITLEIYEDQKDNVKLALKELKERPRGDMEKIIAIMLGLLRTYSTLPKVVLIQFASGFVDITSEEIESIMDIPLFRFYAIEYCRGDDESISVMRYADYAHQEEEISELRKKYAISDGERQICIDDYFDMFYFGMPMRKKSVRTFYSALDNTLVKEFLLKNFDRARVFYDKVYLDCFSHIGNNKLKKLAVAAWQDTPSPVLNGLSPKDYRKVAKEKQEIDLQFTIVPQENARLSKVDVDKYYELYFALLEYVNNKRHVSPQLKKIYRQLHLNMQDIYPIDQFLWSHKKFIDRFVVENPYDFSDEDLETIRGFKKAFSNEHFVIIGFEKDYAKFYSPTRHKIYMVKGLRDNFDNLIPSKHIPIIIEATLLNFNDHITFSSIFTTSHVDLGNSWKKTLIEECKDAEVCYSLQ